MFSHLNWLHHDPVADLHALKLDLIRAGKEIIDLSMINPDLPPHRFLLDKLLEATVRPVNHKYAVARGVRKLREAFAVKYERRFNVALNPEDQICVAMGSKDAIEHSLLCVAQQGDKILMGKPVYPAFLSAAQLAGLIPEFFELSSDESLMLLNIEEELKKSRAKILLLNFPNNPTGIIVSKSFYQKLATLAERYGVFVINDFAYGEMCYNGAPADSLLQVPYFLTHGIEVYSLSKAYNIPGWRVGAVLGNRDLIANLAKLKAHIDYGIFLPIQIAAASALTEPKGLIEQTVQSYHARASLLSNGLLKLGWSVALPSVGACLWAKAPSTGMSSHQFAKHLLESSGIAVMPGEAFLQERGNDFIRFALVVNENKLSQVLTALS